ncbi:sugar transferase [Tropicimonas sp.]|uniref:sugar transferase n=1 Tax=Tropicimonas sp. TaxID=2067044 RepID=UPI003A89ED65
MKPRQVRYSYAAPAKRVFDVVLSAVLLVVLLPLILLISLAVLVFDGLPVLYPAQRMKAPRQRFTLLKFRTMETDRRRHEVGVSGGDKRHRITRLGRALRRTRLDELPQLMNVLAGDMSFVGPRPPAPRYVKRHPGIYAEVLRSRTGITGLATVIFHSHEEMLLSQTRTAAETEQIYVRRCIPRKARLDLIYRDNQSLGLDLYLIYLTAGKLVPLPGRRVKRLSAKARRVSH